MHTYILKFNKPHEFSVDYVGVNIDKICFNIYSYDEKNWKLFFFYLIQRCRKNRSIITPMVRSPKTRVYSNDYKTIIFYCVRR